MDDLTKIQEAAKTLLKVYDDGICGRKVDMDAWRRMITGSAFGAAAYEFDPDTDSAPSGMIQCLLRAIIDPTDPALDHLRACNQPTPPNPPVKPESPDLHKAVARKLWDVNCPDQTYDDALSGAKAGNHHDAKALEFIHDLADAAIAVVVDRCAQIVQCDCCDACKQRDEARAAALREAASVRGWWLGINGHGEPDGTYCSVKPSDDPNARLYVNAEAILALIDKQAPTNG